MKTGKTNQLPSLNQPAFKKRHQSNATEGMPTIKEGLTKMNERTHVSPSPAKTGKNVLPVLPKEAKNKSEIEFTKKGVLTVMQVVNPDQSP